MPSTSIDDCSIRYRVLGQGVPVVISTGGRGSFERVMPLAEKLATDFRVILWDRPTLGRSDLAFKGASDLDMWSDQLVQLLRRLDAWPAYLVAASSGARVSIRTALRYPDAVKGMFLWLLSGGAVADVLAQAYYGDAADAARSGGMESVARLPYWADRIRDNPANRGRLLAQSPTEFVDVMCRWAGAIRSEDLLVGVTESDLARLSIHTAIAAVWDDGGHTRERIERAAALIPFAELVESPGILEEWQAIRQKAEIGTGYELLSPLPGLIGTFILKMQARYLRGDLPVVRTRGAAGSGAGLPGY
ncbi:MAG: alpha/beta hydrolase [Burkholderiaceae bacterium]|nr:alpha/beta hydrolase [Burkholderiaceae bacterium]